LKTAMVIDDEQFHRELLEIFLGTMGFSRIWSACTPEEAKAFYRNAVPKPAVVLLDHQLGPADGLRLLREMLEEDESIRFVFLSTDPEVERECYKVGAAEFVRKPYSIAEIGRAVNRAMRPGIVS
jgi:FixJ family two-component response regulator